MGVVHPLAACLWLIAACAEIAAPPAAPTARAALGYESLMHGRTLPGPVGLDAYVTPPAARPASLAFSGRLILSTRGRAAGTRLVKDRKDRSADARRELLALPDFDFEFVQSGASLIPLRRGSLPGASPHWEYLLEPGRVWQEPGDHGLARAVVPFALQERNGNCIHYGLLTFLFGPRGTASQAAYQISSETCPDLQFDLWGLAGARYILAVAPAAARIAQEQEREWQSRLPARPIDRLRIDYPGADPEQFGAAAEVAPAGMTVFGFLIDGVHYTGGCDTRHGAYPDCDALDLPSWSLAKGIFAGVALMRLERLFPGTAELRVADYVPECVRAGNWDDVSFRHALDLATGNYHSAEVFFDERAPHVRGLFESTTHARKIAYACGEFPRREPPGSRWVYHSSDSYVLGAALNTLVKRRLGPDRDLYADVLVRGLWRPLGLSPVMEVTRRTDDEVAQPFTGWGLVLQRDDVVRIGRWLAADRGRLAGHELLDPQMLAAALQQDPGDPGLPSLGPAFRFKNGFYAQEVSRELGCPRPVWVPYLAGYGGIIVALFPNGTIYYYFSDGDTFDWLRAAIAAHRIRSFCGDQ